MRRVVVGPVLVPREREQEKEEVVAIDWEGVARICATLIWTQGVHSVYLAHWCKNGAR